MMCKRFDFTYASMSNFQKVKYPCIYIWAQRRNILLQDIYLDSTMHCDYYRFNMQYVYTYSTKTWSSLVRKTPKHSFSLLTKAFSSFRRWRSKPVEWFIWKSLQNWFYYLLSVQIHSLKKAIQMDCLSSLFIFIGFSQTFLFFLGVFFLLYNQS